MNTRQKILESWKNLPKNLTQNTRFKREIDDKAFGEAKKIVEKLDREGKNKYTPWDTTGNFVKSTPMMKGADFPTSWTQKDQAIQNVFNQVKKVRRRIAKEKGII